MLSVASLLLKCSAAGDVKSTMKGSPNGSRPESVASSNQKPPKSDGSASLSQKEREERVRLLRERQDDEHRKKLEEFRRQQEHERDIRHKQQLERRRRVTELKQKEDERRRAVEERRRRQFEMDKERRQLLVRRYEDRESLQRDRRSKSQGRVVAFGSSVPRNLASATSEESLATKPAAGVAASNRMAVSTSNLRVAGGGKSDSTTGSPASSVSPALHKISERSSSTSHTATNNHMTGVTFSSAKVKHRPPPAAAAAPPDTAVVAAAAGAAVGFSPRESRSKVKGTVGRGLRSAPNSGFMRKVRSEMSLGPRNTGERLAARHAAAPHRSAQAGTGRQAAAAAADARGDRGRINLHKTRSEMSLSGPRGGSKAGSAWARAPQRSPASTRTRAARRTSSPACPNVSNSEYAIAPARSTSNLNPSTQLHGPATTASQTNPIIQLHPSGATSNSSNLRKARSEYSLPNSSMWERLSRPKASPDTTPGAPPQAHTPAAPVAAHTQHGAEPRGSAGVRAKSATVTPPARLQPTPARRAVSANRTNQQKQTTPNNNNNNEVKPIPRRPVIPIQTSPTHSAEVVESAAPSAPSPAPSDASSKDSGNSKEAPAVAVLPPPAVRSPEPDRSSEEEAARAALAEKRRQAREKAERESEFEQQRQEQLRLEEEERQRQEQEELQRLEEEQMRIEEIQRKAEEERFRKAVEERERKEEHERQKQLEEQRKREERERLEKERQEMLDKEEEERLERKKKLAAIMSRTRNSKTPDQRSDGTSSPALSDHEPTANVLGSPIVSSRSIIEENANDMTKSPLINTDDKSNANTAPDTTAAILNNTNNPFEELDNNSSNTNNPFGDANGAGKIFSTPNNPFSTGSPTISDQKAEFFGANRVEHRNLAYSNGYTVDSGVASDASETKEKPDMSEFDTLFMATDRASLQSPPQQQQQPHLVAGDHENNHFEQLITLNTSSNKDLLSNDSPLIAFEENTQKTEPARIELVQQ